MLSVNVLGYLNKLIEKGSKKVHAYRHFADRYISVEMWDAFRDAANYLDNDVMIVEYLKAAAEDKNPEMFLVALEDVARVKGMTEVAKRTGLGRESLYKALRPGSHPQYQTISSVLRAVGVKITFTKSDA